jgi:hypothetical protein
LQSNIEQFGKELLDSKSGTQTRLGLLGKRAKRKSARRQGRLDFSLYVFIEGDNLRKILWLEFYGLVVILFITFRTNRIVGINQLVATRRWKMVRM